jgi:hypothetical protein
MFKILSTYICWKKIYKMQYLEGSGTPVLYRVSQEECARLRERVPYVKVYRYDPKTPISKAEWLRR